MVERDPLVGTYSHLRDFPRADDALLMLRKVASLVKPIMRARGWRVPELAEFYPTERNLLGLNVNRGERILLRLRFASDRTLFLAKEEVVDTMLHELVHIVRGPHDREFHALWNQLRDEMEALIRKGYTGEGFLSEGRRLGGSSRLPLQEARRLARVAAEKRRRQLVLAAGSGRRLGGAAPRPDQDIRTVIADAVERRNRTLRGCGNTTHNDDEIQLISESATRNGFRTRADEDAANEAAIAQALWELVQEDEMAKYGDDYVPPSAQDPMGTVRRKRSSSSGSTPLSSLPPTYDDDDRPGEASSAGEWVCKVCTLHNPDAFLCCDACGAERGTGASRTQGRPAETRPTRMQRQPQQQQRMPPPRQRPPAGAPAVVDLTGSSPPGRRASPPPRAPPSPPPVWECSRCGNIMAREWWTCGMCGNVKENSR